MSKSDYPDYPPQRIRKHRLVVGDATFIVSSNVDNNKRWIREVHHVRRHRKGGSAEVSVYPNGGRKPSAALESLWAHLGIDPGARWKECAADHPAFPAKRSIRTAMDAVDDARKNAAAAAELVAAGWTWVDDGAGHWEAPPAQAVDLGQFRPAVCAMGLYAEDPEDVDEAKRLLALIDSKASDGEPNAAPIRLTEPAQPALFYIQDTRQVVGNCPVWWGPNSGGYVTRLDEAGRYTEQEAISQNRTRETDIPWPCAEIDALARKTVDCQHMRPRAERLAELIQMESKEVGR